MKMKKFGAIVLAGLMAVSLVGCGGNSSSKNEEKTYIIATDKTYPPFEMEDDSGKLVGVDMDLIRALSKQMGYQNCKIVNMGFDALIPVITSSQYMESVWNSVVYAVIAACIGTLISIFIAYLAVKTKIKGRSLPDLLVVIGGSTPSIVIALALIIT